MKKIITLLLLSSMLFACGGTKTAPKTELVDAWNNASEKNLGRTAIVLNEDTNSTILFHVEDDATIDANASKCESDAEYAEKIKAANAEFNTAATEFINATEFTPIEDGEKLFSALNYKFEVKNPELLIDPEGISFIFYEDLHVEVTYKEEVSYYSVTEEAFASLKAIADAYLEVLLAQPEACIVQNFVK